MMLFGGNVTRKRRAEILKSPIATYIDKIPTGDTCSSRRHSKHSDFCLIHVLNSIRCRLLLAVTIYN
jgi:hypothetical protein